MGRVLWQFMLMVGRKFQQTRWMQSASSLTTSFFNLLYQRSRVDCMHICLYYLSHENRI
jgi:hypothetical protein